MTLKEHCKSNPNPSIIIYKNFFEGSSISQIYYLLAKSFAYSHNPYRKKYSAFLIRYATKELF